MKDVFSDSSIGQGLENLFSLESIGIMNENTSTYDVNEIDRFRKSIKLINNNYYIDTPWHKELLAKVPNNFQLSKTVARKVSEKNGAMNEDYFKVFSEQLDLRIVERLPPSFNPNEHIFIPHRPVIRHDELVHTSNIRPVFNCSLKVGKYPSRNEAAYPGTDMLNELSGLFLYFRTNNYVILADIAKEFLSIKLNKETDKNCFSFVVFNKGKFYYFRYTTIIFGFISSLFILNYILRYHSENCNNLIVKDVLCIKLYVDNLVYTHDSKDVLVNNVSKVTTFLGDGGFMLRE